jgi:aspartyl aminopeptidase
VAADDPVLSDLLDFLRASPTPFHAVASAVERLEKHGFVRVREHEAWPKGTTKRYLVHEGSTLLAWIAPDARAPRAFRITGSHTDSPNLRLKPRAAFAREGYEQLGVEVYGGALLNSWLDRDLGIAGRLIVRDSSEPRLVTIDRAIARVAQLAIHLDRDVNERGLVLNKQQHLAPIVGLSEGFDPIAACASEIGVAPPGVSGADLMLFDLTAPAIGGAKGELLFSARLDNLAMCHATISALTRASESGARADDAASLVALFDHEEVGSQSAAGAASSILPRVLERIVLAGGGDREAFLRALAASACVSADMAHAVHPNYADRHDEKHKVMLNGGPVIKTNAQQRYATSASTAALFAEACREAEVPVQQYVHRTDLPCGTTIGPIVATHLGIPTVDVGNAMLSMHSAREMAGTADPAMMTCALARFFSR